MGSIQEDSYVSSIISGCRLMLGLAKNSMDIASNSSTSFVEASLAKASVFEFLDRGMTLIEVVEKVPIDSLAFYK